MRLTDRGRALLIFVGILLVWWAFMFTFTHLVPS